MEKLQNLHTHTLYCDGTLSAEDMVKAALKKGCGSFGFSGHSYAPYDTGCCMSWEDTDRYMQDIRQLQKEYAGRIELYLGIEQDYFAEPPTNNVDYIIGAVHYIKEKSVLSCIDSSAQSQEHACDAYYGGDYYAMAERYFETVSDVAKKTNADIVAHFDLITKFNADGKLFDESHPRYVSAALSAMDEALKTCSLFEVNTGAMYKYRRQEPYPSTMLLNELHKRGGEVILSSDSHDAESICHRFGEMRELLKYCGFKYAKHLTKSGFANVLL